MKEEKTKTRKPKAPRRRYDSAWKSVIRLLLKQFLEFFFPVIHDAIDFDKEIIFLDKELKEINPNSNVGDREADVLVKVHLKDGTAQYICLVAHIEVQGVLKPDLMERIFVYFYRIFDKEKEEKIPVISVALLTDADPDKRPDEYGYDLLGFSFSMKIPIVKIIDYKLKPELRRKLETTTNPMAMIVRAQLKSHELKGVPHERKFEVIKELIRECYRQGYDRDTTQIVLNFFDWAIRFPEAFKGEIRQVIKEVEEEYKMDYVPIWLRDKYEEGWEKGMSQGKTKWMSKGEEIGMAKGADDEKVRVAKRMLADGLQVEIISKYTGLSLDEVKKLKQARREH